MEILADPTCGTAPVQGRIGKKKVGLELKCQSAHGSFAAEQATDAAHRP
jgi:hypothetical protein